MNTNRADKIASRWTTSLSTVPSVFGRLLILSSLRDRNTGWYVHHGLALELGEATHSFLLKSHEELFLDWQQMTMQEQMRDLKGHLRNVVQSAEGFGREHNQTAKIVHVLNTWTLMKPYRELVPFSVSPLEQDGFVNNITTLIALLKSRVDSVRASGTLEDVTQLF